MLDASGKPTSGIFQGSLSMLGNYKQCLAIRAPDEDEIEITDQFEEYFRGRYCVLQMKPWLPAMPAYYNLNATIEPLLRKSYKYYEKTLYDDLAEIASAFNFVNIRVDLCIPSNCNEADIQRVADLLGRKLEMRAKVMRCDTESREPWWSKIDSSSATWTTITIALASLPLIATMLTLGTKIFCSNKADNLSWFRESLRCLSLGAIVRDRLQQIPLKQTQLIFANNNEFDRDTSSSSRSEKKPETNCDANTNIDEDKSANNSTKSENSLEISTRESELPTEKINQSISDFLENPKIFKPTEESQLALETGTSNVPSQLQIARITMIIWFIIVQLSADLNYQYLRESLLLRDLLFSYWPFQLIINSTLLFETLILLTAFTYGYKCFGWSAYRLLSFFVQKYLRSILPIIAITSLTIMLPMINIESPIWRNLVDQQASLCKTNGFINLFMLQNFIPYDKMVSTFPSYALS